tara:strand:- start:177618 stop:179015 length:1398 start_codon:yes stop_codon:yes gene_type:complete
MSESYASDSDTIAAIATAAGQGGVGIIRLSGPQARAIGEALTHKTLTPRYAHFSSFHSATGQALDSGIVLYFPAPHSFTGEEVVELQAHGGPVILDMLQREAFGLGARPARPGEFSERAYLNNKLDLAQAEAIADLISSTTEQAALSASRSLQGAFSQKIDALVEQVTQLRVYVEAAIDFPEEEIDFLADAQVHRQLAAIGEQLAQVKREALQGSLMREGLKLVIAGKPNAGKSSLLNALSGQNTAIVTAIEGTTRDVLREHIQIDGMPLHIVDTAGLRESDNVVEQEGIRRAWQEIESADRILLVVDASVADQRALPASQLLPIPQTSRQDIDRLKTTPVTVIFNKCDAAMLPPEIEETPSGTRIHLSAKTGQGIDLLTSHLKSCAGYNPGSEGSFSARRRHLVALDKAEEFLQSGSQQLQIANAGELLAEDLRQCQQCLGEITGFMSSDDLLGEIFSSFCIGK